MKELKNGFKLFYIKDGDLHQVLLTEDQEYIFQNLCDLERGLNE